MIVKMQEDNSQKKCGAKDSPCSKDSSWSSPCRAVGQFYDHFNQTTDEEVIDVLHTMSV